MHLTQQMTGVYDICLATPLNEQALVGKVLTATSHHQANTWTLTRIK